MNLWRQRSIGYWRPVESVQGVRPFEEATCRIRHTSWLPGGDVPGLCDAPFRNVSIQIVQASLLLTDGVLEGFRSKTLGRIR